MSESPNQSQTETTAESPKQRNWAEWMTFIASSSILLTLIGLIIYDWLLTQQSPPILEVHPQGVVEIRQEQFYQPFLIKNVGGNFAESVQIVASLTINSPEDMEVGEQQISFLAAGEQKSGYFIFTHDPREGELTMRVASYR
ncbi:MAG: TIGR02588 family protein [Cyanobacteria bacterium SW_9_44_58]|nr:MAG: TIGR02588 family protein [Cyanobacteria bacterium SW_9_44_58]